LEKTLLKREILARERIVVVINRRMWGDILDSFSVNINVYIVMHLLSKHKLNLFFFLVDE
jgi:hypothetical protein